MNAANRVQTLDEAVCISQSAKTPANGKDPTILPPAMSRIGWNLQPMYVNWSWGRKTLNSNLLNFTKKNWPYVTFCSCQGVSKYIKQVIYKIKKSLYVFIYAIQDLFCAFDSMSTPLGLVYHIYQPLRSGRIWHKVNF